MAHYVFNFKGSDKRKFRLAGRNYVLKILRLVRDKATLISFLENNYSEVCEDGCAKGFCVGTCKGCPVQEAYAMVLKELAMKPETVTITYNRCSFGELPACMRTGKTLAELRKECEFN